jgi:hypothetical protein
LAKVDIDETADELFAALDAIDVEDCWDRSGRSRHGYTSPDEAATELIADELRPFVDQVERYHRLGMPEQEARYCLGIISGLYRYERESKTEFRQWSEDIAGDCAGLLLDEWRQRNPAEDGSDAMRALPAERCPEWVKWLGERQAGAACLPRKASAGKLYRIDFAPVAQRAFGRLRFEIVPAIDGLASRQQGAEFRVGAPPAEDVSNLVEVIR